MPRLPRKISTTGIYHVMVRGINKQELFLDNEDNHRYLESIARVKSKENLIIYAYCLMGNHVHVLVKEGLNGIGIAMKMIGTRYALWFNKKYQRCGHVFQDRFKSEPVEDERYLLTVFRYIHLNPVAAMLVSQAEDWQWSSYGAYLHVKEEMGLVETDFILKHFSDDQREAVERLKSFMSEQNTDTCLDMEESSRLTDEQLQYRIEEVAKKPIADIKTLSISDRNSLIKMIKQIDGVSQRQIARLLKLSKSVVYKA